LFYIYVLAVQIFCSCIGVVSETESHSAASHSSTHKRYMSRFKQVQAGK